MARPKAAAAKISDLTAEPAAGEPRPLGRRERSKQDKLRRIIQAARTLFEEKGFEPTTTVAIAEAADIGVGTLFLYAKSKEDVLLLVFTNDLVSVVEKTFAKTPRRAPLIDQLLHMFDGLVRHHARDLDLSRHLIRELTVVKNPERVDDIQRLTLLIYSRLADIIEQAPEAAHLRAGLSANELAEQLFALYFGLLTFFLKGVFTLQAFRVVMRRSFAVHLDGALVGSALTAPALLATRARKPAAPAAKVKPRRTPRAQ